MNQLKGMLSRDMDSSLDNGDRSKRSAQLVYLSEKRREISLMDHGSRITGKCDAATDISGSTYPIDESPVPRFNKERKLLEYSTQKSILEDESVRGCNSLLESEKSNVSPPRCERPRRLVLR